MRRVAVGKSSWRDCVHWLRLLALGLAVLAPSAAAQAGNVVLVDDAAGFIGPQVRALSADGRIGAGSDLFANGFVWDGGFTAVPSIGGSSSFVFDLSQDGSIAVGSGSTGPRQEALRYSAGSGSVSLGSLAPGTSSGARAVSADGALVVGDSNGMPFRWTAATSMVAIPGVVGFARDVSGDGQIVTGTVLGVAIEAYVWSETGGLTGLGSLPDYENSAGNAISADGSTVVGGAYDEDTDTNQPFRWTSSEGMVGLGTWPDCPQLYANAVSGDGSLIAGDCWRADGITRIPFLWTESTGLQTLGTFLAQRGIALPKALQEPEITAVSADGRVIAVVDLDQNGVWSLLIDVTPEIPALRGVGRAALGVMLTVFAAVGLQRRASATIAMSA